jgi:hypothetical protein
MIITSSSFPPSFRNTVNVKDTTERIPVELTVTERRRRRLVEVIREFQRESERGAHLIKVMDQLKKEGLPLHEFPRYLGSILREGVIYETDREHVRTTK